MTKGERETSFANRQPCGFVRIICGKVWSKQRKYITTILDYYITLLWKRKPISDKRIRYLMCWLLLFSISKKQQKISVKIDYFTTPTDLLIYLSEVRVFRQVRINLIHACLGLSINNFSFNFWKLTIMLHSNNCFFEMFHTNGSFCVAKTGSRKRYKNLVNCFFF